MMAQEGEEGCCQPHDDADGEQQHNSGEHGKCKPDRSAFFTLVFGEAVGNDGYEDDIVNAKDNLKSGKGCQGYPGFGLRDPFHCFQGRLVVNYFFVM